MCFFLWLGGGGIIVWSRNISLTSVHLEMCILSFVLFIYWVLFSLFMPRFHCFVCFILLSEHIKIGLHFIRDLVISHYQAYFYCGN